MMRRLPIARAGLLLSALALMTAAPAARAQDIEPRAYSNAPIGMNFLIAGYAYTEGGLSFDSASPISNPKLTTSNAVLAYARVFEIAGQSAKCDLIAPITWLDGSADYAGARVHRDIFGLTDPRFRLSVNFHGGPALALKEFRAYRQRLLVGGSLQVSVPVGQYDDARLVNLGTHRWYFKPELGVSRALGRWTLDVAGAVTLFSDNDAFYQGTTRSQDPLYSLQGHVIRAFRSGIWGAFDANYFLGGQVSVNGMSNGDPQENWRLGGTLVFPIDVHSSLKLYGSSGVSARTGNNFDLAGIGWQFRWGGGL
ncbi:MAG: hypothetical protein FD129_393 [bacterium]|nr:MAG: hypothetical protein FD129_393 [bacterium]